jgi:hypothetical protein
MGTARQTANLLRSLLVALSPTGIPRDAAARRRVEGAAAALDRRRTRALSAAPKCRESVVGVMQSREMDSVGG